MRRPPKRKAPKNRPKPKAKNQSKGETIIQGNNKPNRLLIILKFLHSYWKKWYVRFGFFVGVLALLINISNIFPTYTFYKEYLNKKDREQRETETESGILISPYYDKNDDAIGVGAGTNFMTLSPKDYQFNDFNVDAFTIDHLDSPAGLKLRIEDNKILISTTFTNYYGEVVGEISRNHWTVFKSDEMKVGNNAQEFEVVDKNKNVMFSVKFSSSNTIRFYGYKVYGDLVVVVNKEGVFTFNKKKTKESEIKYALDRIPKMFKY